MRRLVIALLVSIAAVAPGIAHRLAQDRVPPRGQEHRGRQPRTADPTVVPQLVGRAADRRAFAGAGVCEPSFGADISPLFTNAPGNGWVTGAADCSAQPGCDDYFVVSCDPGALVQASFCSHGGQASWNTNLSVWDGATEQLCVDDSCGLQTEAAYVHSGALYQRFRVGGTNDASGPYTLAVNIPSNCLVGGPIAVELRSVDVE